MKKGNKIFNVVLFTLLIAGCSKDEIIEPIVEKATLSITATANAASEPGINGEFRISLDKVLSNSVQVTFSIGGTATNGVDYKTIASSATILANRSSVTIPIEILDDGNTEETETVIVTITAVNNDNVSIGGSNTATVSISDQPEAFVLLPSETSSYMVNPNATAETIALFYNLKTLSKSNFLVGQQDAFNAFYNNNIGDSDIKKTTGSDPGLLGSDFMFITDDLNDETPTNWFYQQEQIIKEDAIEAYDKGMVNVFAWHLREPYEGLDFYTENMSEFQKTNAFTSILPDGENHEYYKQKLDKVAQVAKSMVGNDGKLVPFIFRPFHEFDGNWFWWGAAYCTPQQFIEVWRFTVDYLKDTQNVRNMLFAFSPDKNFNSDAEYLSRYPGDEYVDVLGMDNYGDFDNQGQMGLDSANSKLQILTSLADEKVKIAALTESCYFVTPGETNPIPGFYANNLYGALTQNNVEIGFMMFWTNSLDTYCTPTPGQSSTDDFIEFISKPEPLLANDLPDMYSLPPDS